MEQCVYWTVCPLITPNFKRARQNVPVYQDSTGYKTSLNVKLTVVNSIIATVFRKGLVLANVINFISGLAVTVSMIVLPIQILTEITLTRKVVSAMRGMFGIALYIAVKLIVLESQTLLRQTQTLVLATVMKDSRGMAQSV